MGTPYYSSKATTKTASLISSSGGSSSPSKTSSSKPSSTSQSPSGGYLKSTEVNVKLDESGREVSRTTTVTSGGVSTQTSQTLKSAGKEVVQPGSKLVKGGSTSAPTPPGYLQTKEKVVVQPGKRLQPPYPYEFESFLAQTGPSPDHPAYISSQRFGIQGFDVPIYSIDVNLPSGAGREMIETRLKEYSPQGYVFSEVQLDTDPELERVYYPKNFVPAGGKITKASLVEIETEEPKLTKAEREYQQKYSPGIKEKTTILDFNVEYPSNKYSSDFPMSIDEPQLPGFKGPLGIPAIESFEKKPFYVGSSSVTFASQSLEEHLAREAWLSKRVPKDVVVTGPFGTATYKEGEKWYPEALALEFTKGKMENIYSGTSFAKTLSAWDKWVDENPANIYLKEGGKRIGKEVRWVYGTAAKKFKIEGASYIAGRAATEFGVGGVQALTSIPDFIYKAAGRAYTPFEHAFKTGDPVRTGHEVATTYTWWTYTIPVSIGSFGLYATKEPVRAAYGASGFVGAAYTASFVFGKSAQALGQIKGKLLPAQQKNIFLTKSQLDKMNKDWELNKANYEKELLASEKLTRARFIEDIMIKGNMKAKPGIMEQAKTAVGNKIQEASFYALGGAKDPTRYYNFWFKYWGAEGKVENFLKGTGGTYVAKPLPIEKMPIEKIGGTEGLFTKTEFYGATGAVKATGPGGMKVYERLALAKTSIKPGAVTSTFIGGAYDLGRKLSVSLDKTAQTPSFIDVSYSTTPKIASFGPLGMLKQPKDTQKMRYYQGAKIEAYEMANIEDALRNPTREMFKEQLRMEQKYGTRNLMGVGVGVGVGVRTGTRTSMMQGQRQAERQGIRTIIGLGMGIGLRTPTRAGFRFRQKLRQPELTTIKFAFGTGEDTYSMKRVGKHARKKRTAGTPPSFYALEVGLKGKKIPKMNLISGVGIRPITPGWSKKRVGI